MRPVRSQLIVSRTVDDGRQPRPIPDPLIELIGDRLRLLALPMRMKIVDHLDHHGEANVQGLADHFEATQQNVSRHLRLLADAAVLDRRQDGRVVWYRLCDPAAFRLIEDVASQVLPAYERIVRDLTVT